MFNTSDLIGINDNVGLFSFVIVIAIVDLILKGWGMWRSARLDEKWWFVAVLVVNSAGILPALYLYSTRKKYAQKFPKIASTSGV